MADTRPSHTTSPIGGTTGSRALASPLVIAGRLAMLLFAVVAVGSAFVLGRGHDRAARSFGGPYACPMHPEVTSTAPGECAVCRMALERVSTSRRDEAAAGRDARGSSAQAEAAAGPASHSFPESAERPNYKLIASIRRRAFAGVVRAPAWVESPGRVVAMLYVNELSGLDAGEPGRFLRAAAPAAGIAVRRAAEPAARWDPSTTRVAFRAAPGAPDLEAGDVGWVELAARSRDLLAVPVSAVLFSPQGAYVLVAAPDGLSFARRPLEVGQVIAGQAIVLSGLREGERVVVGNTFFLEAERRLSQRTDLAEVAP